MLRHRLFLVAVVPVLLLVFVGCSGTNGEPSQDVRSDNVDDTVGADTINCPDGLVLWPEYNVCAPRVDECEAWEVPVIGGGCMAVGPRACPKLWDPDADVDCEPGELMDYDGAPCPEGFVLTEDGVACVPVPLDPVLDMPYFDECPPGHLALEGGGCAQVGPRGCPKVWDPDADVDCEVGDVLPCPEGWLESEDGMYCHPGWDECQHGEVPLTGCCCQRLLPLAADCPTGPFPEVPEGATDVFYVLADSTCTDGCGSEAAPFPSIQDAIDSAPSGAAVLIGPGTYDEGLTLTKPVHVIGLCASLVEVTGKALVLPDWDSKVMEAGVGVFDVQNVTLSGLRVRSPAAGVAIVGAVGVVLEGLDITESHGVALYIDGGSGVEARDLWIHDTEPGSGEMDHGRGAWVGGGAILEAQAVLVEKARRTGIMVDGEGTLLALTDGVIRATNPDNGGTRGRGLQAQEGCTVSLTGSLLEDNREVSLAVFNAGTMVEVSGSVIRKTLPDQNGESGFGIQAADGCSVSVARSLMEENRKACLVVAQPGSKIEVAGSVIRKTSLDNNGEWGRGIVAYGSGSVSVAGSLLDENRDVAVFVTGSGTKAQVSGSMVRGTLPNAKGDGGWGMLAAAASAVLVTDSLLEENRVAGLAVFNPGTEVGISGSVIRKTLPDGNGGFGRGIQASEGCAVSITASLLEENRDGGLMAGQPGTEVEVTGSVIRKTLPNGSGAYGTGIDARDGCKVSVTGSLVEENRQIGIAVLHSGTEVQVTGSVIRETLPDENMEAGIGILATEGCTVSVAGSLLERNRDLGMGVDGFGTRVEVSGSVVRETLGNMDGEQGNGILASGGCVVALMSCLLEENRESGLVVFDPGTEMDVSGSVIRKTMPNDHGEGGAGIHAVEGSTVSLAGSLLEDNKEIGIAGFFTDTVVEVSGSVIRDTQPNNDGRHGEGLFVIGGASGTASWCRIEGNNTAGIAVYGRSIYPPHIESSVLYVKNSAILDTEKGGTDILGGDYEVFGDGVFVGGGGQLHLDSVVLMSNTRTGGYFHDSTGSISNTVTAGNGSYGLAMQDSDQFVDHTNSFIFGNVLEAVTTSPQGLPVPPLSEFMEAYSPPR